MSYEYIVDTSKGQLRFRTERHHSRYRSIMAWRQDHVGEIAALVGATASTIQIFEIQHQGKKIG